MGRDALYGAQLDADGSPIRDSQGRLIKGDLVGYSVMEKGRGSGARGAPESRGSEWSFQTFTAEKTINAKADLPACFRCHKTRDQHDFIFSDNEMRAVE